MSIDTFMNHQNVGLKTQHRLSNRLWQWAFQTKIRRKWHPPKILPVLVSQWMVPWPLFENFGMSLVFWVGQLTKRGRNPVLQRCCTCLGAIFANLARARLSRGYSTSLSFSGATYPKKLLQFSMPSSARTHVLLFFLCHWKGSERAVSLKPTSR